MSKIKNSLKYRLKKLMGLFQTRAVVVSILLGAALWIYSNMNTEFVSFVTVPISVKLPTDRALENPLPPTVTLQARGTGWQLFNLIFMNSNARCTIDLSKNKITDSVYEITRNDIIKNVAYMNNTQAIDVYPQSLELRTGRIGEYSVPVILQTEIIPKDGFTIVGTPEIKPDMINITGNDKVARNIKQWSTEHIKIKDVYEPFTKSIPLSDSIRSVISLSQNNVKISANIQQESYVTFNDIEIKVKGEDLPARHKLEPPFISITIKGGIDVISKITFENISAYVTYDKIMKDTTGIIVPVIEVPDGTVITRVNPSYVYHIKEMNSGVSNLSKLK